MRPRLSQFGVCALQQLATALVCFAFLLQNECIMVRAWAMIFFIDTFISVMSSLRMCPSARIFIIAFLRKQSYNHILEKNISSQMFLIVGQLSHHPMSVNQD